MIQDIFPHKYNNVYKNVKADESAPVVIYAHSHILCKCSDTEVSFPSAGEAERIWGVNKETFQFLLTIDETDYFLCAEKLEEKDGYIWHNLLDIRGLEPIDVSFAAIVGAHIAHWYAGNKFCGRCGHANAHKADQRALVCPECGQIVFPRINPITITAVVDGDKMLVAKYNRAHFNNRNNNYVLLAGYVEIGESYEDTVKREVREETGLEVKKIRYAGSQPWPFSDTSIAGFYAEADSTLPLKRQEEELSELLWLKREDLPPRKNRTSITDNLIEWFRHDMSLEEIQAERDNLG